MAFSACKVPAEIAMDGERISPGRRTSQSSTQLTRDGYRGGGDIHTQVYAYDGALPPNMYGMCPLCSAERVPSYLSTLRLRTVSVFA